MCSIGKNTMHRRLHVDYCCYIAALKGGPSGPGEGGKAVVIPSHLEEKSKEMFKVNQFNLLASDLMSLNRSLPDYRISG